MTARMGDCGGGLTATWDDEIEGPLTITYDGVGDGEITTIPWQEYPAESTTTSIVLPEGLTVIKSQTFFYFDQVTTELVIPSTVTYIGSYAFYGVPYTTGVRFLGNQPTMGTEAFSLNYESDERIYNVYSNGWANETTFPAYETTKWNYMTFASSVLKKKISGTYKQGILWRKISGTYKQGRLWKNIGGIWR